MESITKTELSWIVSSLNHHIEEYEEYMTDLDENSTTVAILKLNRDALKSVRKKILLSLNNGDKRIAII